MTKVIIGAGPAGIYTAIKLRKAGITDIIVFDPRAGNYTRPGHLNGQVFIDVGHSLVLNLWRVNTRYHIKDLERVLYNEAIKLGVKFEHKRFLRLHQDEKQPGVIVDNNGVEEFIAADFVFDCTGSRREVIKAVNHIIPESPLQLTTITKLPITNHFLAYVKMEENDWIRFQKASSKNNNLLENMDALTYAQSIIQLRALGWKEFILPRCYGVNFTKNKVCLYFHAPETLLKEHYEHWVQTVLECYTKPIQYERLPSTTKPRFLPFPSHAQELKQVAYKGKNLPHVIALGDTQIDFDYYLAHGIKDGIKRIDALFEHMKIFDKEIHHFDSKVYQQEIKILLEEHRKGVITQAENLQHAMISALDIGLLKFRKALIQSTDLQEQDKIRDVIKEIEVRQCYEYAINAFKQIHNASFQVIETQEIHLTFSKLINIEADLLKSNEDLQTQFCFKKQANINELLLYIARSFKIVGNTLYKSQDWIQAIEAYKKALKIYKLPCFANKHFLTELPIYSNLVITYLKNNLYSEAITAADTALLIYDNCQAEEQSKALFEKLLFNLIKALYAQAKDFLDADKTDDALLLHTKIKNLLSTHEKELDNKIFPSIHKIVVTLQQDLKNSSQHEEKSSVEENLSLSNLTNSLETHGIFKSQLVIHRNDEVYSSCRL